MELLFKKTVNDKACIGRAFFAGRVYELDDKRAKEIMKALPEAVEALDAPTPKPKKKTNSKKKVEEEPQKVEEEPTPEVDFIETEIEG